LKKNVDKMKGSAADLDAVKGIHSNKKFENNCYRRKHCETNFFDKTVNLDSRKLNQLES